MSTNDKIKFCIRQARKDGLEYLWLDTCGLDKANLTELSESINSMFRWYHDARKCYVYLTDVSVRRQDHATRPEDKAYCLLGIFDVFMSPIYGEGDHALVRLDDAISSKFRREMIWIELFRKPNPPAPGTNVVEACQPKASPDDLLSSLAYDQMHSRAAMITSAHSATCTWLLNHKKYLHWNDPAKFEDHQGFLWVKGKPGAGKSTLIKFAYDEAASSLPRNGVLLSHFFNARGGALKKLVPGMYRSLIQQLLKKTGLLEVFDDVLPSEFHSKSLWTIELLRELLVTIIRKLGQKYRIKCYIEAIDECNEQDILDTVSHFDCISRVSEGSFYVCFASRHYPTIIIRCTSELILDNELGHLEDLSHYVQNHLQLGGGKELSKIKAQVQARVRANGIFLWAVLVIQMLNQGYHPGRIFALEERLHQIPSGLNDVFKNMLRRDCTEIEAFLVCIQLVLFANRPLSLQEFYQAMEVGYCLEHGQDSMRVWDPELSVHDMERLVHDCSKGLAEVVQVQRDSRVQFIHESVRDFLIKDGGLCELRPELRGTLEAQSHNQLGQYCRKCLILTRNGMEGMQAHDRRFPPLLGYAADEVSYHANKSANDIPQTWLLDDDFLQVWRTAVGSSPFTSRTHGSRSSPDLTPANFAVNFASENGYSEILKLLLRSTRDTDTVSYGIALSCATRGGFQESARMLLDNGADIDSKGQDGSTALQTASWRCDPEMVSFLLTNGADVNVIGRNFGNALTDAVSPFSSPPTSSARYEVVKLLLDTGADANSRGPILDNVLQDASICGFLNIEELLLDRGADVNAHGGRSGNALQAAASAARLDVAVLLVNRGADVNGCGDDWFRNLRLSQCEGLDTEKQRVADRLIERGARSRALDPRPRISANASSRMRLS